MCDGMFAKTDIMKMIQSVVKNYDTQEKNIKFEKI